MAAESPAMMWCGAGAGLGDWEASCVASLPGCRFAWINSRASKTDTLKSLAALHVDFSQTREHCECRSSKDPVEHPEKTT